MPIFNQDGTLKYGYLLRTGGLFTLGGLFSDSSSGGGGNVTPTVNHRFTASSHLTDAVTASGTYVRMNRKRERVAATASGNHFVLLHNFYMSNVSTITNGIDTMTQNGTVEVNGVVYPLQYNGASSWTLAPGEVKAVLIVGLSSTTAGDFIYYNIRNIHSNTASVNRIRGVEINARFDEGVVANTNVGIDNTSGYGMGSTATASITGGAITGITFNNTSSNSLYTTGGNLIAFQTQADNTILQRVIGTYTVTAGNPTSATITDVNTDWVSPNIKVCSIAASFGAVNGDIYAPLGLLAIPNDVNARQIVIVGDSNGHSSADLAQSVNGYKGLYERGINGRFATFNMSFSGRTAANVANISTGGLKLLYDTILPYVSDALIALGGNDATTDSTATITSNLNAQATIWRTAGKRAGYSTIPPRTTGTFTSAGGQTPATGFGSGGTVDTLNTAFRSKTIATDFDAFEFRTPVQDVGTPNVWRSDLGYIWTDGTHLTQLGMVNIDATATGALTLGSFSPLSLPGIYQWLDASDTTTISQTGSAVTQWNDKTTNAYHETQGTAANQPMTGTRTVNSLNSLDFDGVNDFLIPNSGMLSIPSGANTVLIAFASDNTGPTEQFIFYGFTAAGGPRFGISFTATAMNAQNRSSSSSPTSSPDTRNTNVRIFGFTRSGTTITPIIDGVAQTAGTNSENYTAILMWTGGSGTTGTGGNFDGRYCERIVCNQALSNTDLNNAGNYLKNKWGGTWVGL